MDTPITGNDDPAEIAELLATIIEAGLLEVNTPPGVARVTEGYPPYLTI
jgi:hypothetical protein